MNEKHTGAFQLKHGPDARPDPKIAEAVERRGGEKGLACAVAFDIAASLGVEPMEVGKTADLLGCRLTKCQLGLFGYSPEKKIVGPKQPEDPAIIQAIENEVKNGRISCKQAWGIAKRFGVRKMTVSSACEAIGIKIKPCQLGAF
ncbi:MAG: hypothetical protein K9L59_15745 [Desulfobacterales bacterium]|nr:hypothetical protein [Desulfobacterales bacterium]